MKDLVALQMTRRQPLAPYDSSKAKSPAQANRQVRSSRPHARAAVMGSERGIPCLFSFCCVVQTSWYHMQAHVFWKVSWI